jgi:uncharacterized repeat protein (TIGR02059 family)
LTLGSPVVAGDVVTVAYTIPSTNQLQSALRRWAYSLSARTVTNNISQSTYKSSQAETNDVQTMNPVYLGSVIENFEPERLEMTYNINLSGTVPENSAFQVKVNGVNRSVNAIDISGNKISLTLQSAVIYGDDVTVSYTEPENNPLQAVTGVKAAPLISHPVTNNCLENSTRLNNISIYPNPAREFINVTIPEPSLETRIIRIFDFSGRLWLESRIEPNFSNIEIPINLKSGVYIVKIVKDNLTMFTQKLVVIE